ncbi:MAG: hypothetical protein JW915_10515 [Chitinispirillaceae bacterium]|nr:hypothetical protein [Chitinispirillaceae bacterium]
MDNHDARALVAECKEEVNKQLKIFPDSEALGRMMVCLDDLEDALRWRALDAALTDLEQAETKLKGITSDIKDEIGDLGEIAEVINKTEKVVKLIVQAAKGLGSLV